MDGTNHSRGSTLQSLSPEKREGLEHELRPEALASIAREENPEAHEISTNISHPTRIAEAVDELWGGALRYEEEL